MRPGRLSGLPQTGQHDDVGIVVEAELGGPISLSRDDVRAFDAGRCGERLGEARRAGVARIGRVGEKDGKVEAEWIGRSGLGIGP